MLLSKQKYIVNCEKEVDPPAYLRNRYRGRVTFDLTPIMKKQTENSTSRYEKKLLRASNLQDAIAHARHLWKKHSFGLPLRMIGMHRTQSDDACFDYRSRVTSCREIYEMTYILNSGQSVEHLTAEREVAGSILGAGQYSGS